LPSTSAAIETVYETTPRKPKFEIKSDGGEEENEDDNDAV
jgi:hypothetical protein